MKRTRCKAIAASMVLAVMASSASADLIIDTIGEWAAGGGQRSGGFFKIAQTLVVPFDKPILNTFEIGVGADGDGRTFHLRVYEWDRSVEHTVGGELFSSGPHVPPILATPSVDFVEFFIGITLSGGTEYAVIADWSFPGAPPAGVAYIKFGSSSYTDGYANFTNGQFDEPWSFAQINGFDMAFRATFKQIPAPGGLALFGLAGLMGTRRRRK